MLPQLRLSRLRSEMRQAELAVTVFCLATLGFAANALAIDPTTYTIEAIRERWSARQQQVQSVKINWQQTRTFRATRRSAENWHGDPNSPGGLARIVYECQLQVDGDKIEYKIESADAIRHNESPSIRETYDGKRSQMFNVSSKDSKTGGVSAAEYGYTGQSLPLFPLYWAFRPLHTSMGAFRLDTATILPHPGIVDEEGECVILRQNANNRSQLELWLDPKLEFLPRRYVNTIDGAPMIRLDIVYAQDAKLGALPNSWKFVWLDSKGQLFDNNEAKVIDYAINPSIPPSAFQIEFPPGTQVADDISKTRYVVGATPVTSDLGATPVTSDSRWLWLILLNAFGLIALIVYLRRRSVKGNAS